MATPPATTTTETRRDGHTYEPDGNDEDYDDQVRGDTDYTT